MNSRFLKRFYAVAALALAGALILPLGPSAMAHADEVEREARLQGTWHVTVTLRNCQTNAQIGNPFASVDTFASGHTFIENTSSPAFLPGQRTPGLGVWSRTDWSTFSAVSEAFILFTSVANPPTPGFQRGVQRITQKRIEVNGDHFVSNASVQFFDATGVLLRTGCATAVGQRFPDQEDAD